MASANFDAVALLIVPLHSHAPATGELCWHDWAAATGAEPHGLPAEIGRKSASEAPFKRLPGQSAWPYFIPHIERLLFPPTEKTAGRWLCCPDDVYLDLTTDPQKPGRRARIELLERLTTSLDPGCAFGLIHLSLPPCHDFDAPDTLEWAKGISTPHRWPYDASKLVLSQGGEPVELDHRRPIRALTRELFGDPGVANLERGLYSVVMASYPDDYDDARREKWLQALVARRLMDSSEGREEAEEVTSKVVEVGPASALLLRGHATFTTPKTITGTSIRNLRSYWSESLLYCLLQQDCLEEFQRRLAEIGDPVNPEVEKLHRRWLRFRNVLWWSQLAGESEVPQVLVDAFRKELGTQQLFDDLEGDLATYSEHQHRVSEEKQAKALANLQIYGAAIVVLGPATTAIGLFEMSECDRWALLVASLLFAVGVSLLVRWLLKRD